MEFRYRQFCPVARAVEILAERWTLLILRELLAGPQRFSDLRRRLPDVSSSVLSTRLERLEEKGIVSRRELDPPAGSMVYELAESGLAVRPVLTELARWGLRFMTLPLPGDHLEPSWVRLGAEFFAREDATPEISAEFRLPDGSRDEVFYVRGGDDGTQVSLDPHATDVQLKLAPMMVLGLLSGSMDPTAELKKGSFEASGKIEVLPRLPELFVIQP